MLGLILYTQLMAFGLLGIVWMGIRRERQQLRRDYEDTLRSFKLVRISKGTRRD